MKESIEFVTVRPEDARNFRIGMALYIEHGHVLRGWRLRWYVVRMRLRHWTRWWRLRTIVTSIDHEHGIVTYGLERWSWRHRRWECVE